MADVGIITGSDIHEPPGVDPNQEHLRRGKPFAPRLRRGLAYEDPGARVA